ncbi:hypothetical protein CLOM_g24018 [Closterium sp. NIES-68]|nr:hypothetical protein CLOM_g24018 [Closterium sp. NIES-68]
MARRSRVTSSLPLLGLLSCLLLLPPTGFGSPDATDVLSVHECSYIVSSRHPPLLHLSSFSAAAASAVEPNKTAAAQAAAPPTTGEAPPPAADLTAAAAAAAATQSASFSSSPVPSSSSPSHYRRSPSACWSRIEMRCYAGPHGMALRSEALRRKLRAYNEYRRECSAKENRTALKAKLTGGIPTECRYLLWSSKSGDGQGNQYVSLVSAFVYALVTNRIFLLLAEQGPAKLMCDPFQGGNGGSWSGGAADEGGGSSSAGGGGDAGAADTSGDSGGGSAGAGAGAGVGVGAGDGDGAAAADSSGGKSGAERWFVFEDNQEELWAATVLAMQQVEEYFTVRVQAMANGTSDSMPVPPALGVTIYHFTTNMSLFFCASEQRWLARVPALLLQANQFFLTPLFYITSFRRHLSDLFPSGRIFQTISQLIMFPQNHLWAAITQNIHARAAPAAARIGLQLRHWHEDTVRDAATCIEAALLKPELAEARLVRLDGGLAAEVGTASPSAFAASAAAGAAAGNSGGVAGSGSEGDVSSSISGNSIGSSSGSDSPGEKVESVAGARGVSERVSVRDVTAVVIASLNPHVCFNVSQLLFRSTDPLTNITYTSGAPGASDGINRGSSGYEGGGGVKDERGEKDERGGGVATQGSQSTSADSLEAAFSAVPSTGMAREALVSSSSISNGSIALERITVETSQTGLQSELEHAIVDIYSLALACDVVLTFPASTFGYLVSSLFARPAFFIERSCYKAPMEPCMHHAPPPFQCPGGGGNITSDYEGLRLAGVPLQRCPDSYDGVLLRQDIVK